MVKKKIDIKEIEKDPKTEEVDFHIDCMDMANHIENHLNGFGKLTKENKVEIINLLRIASLG